MGGCPFHSSEDEPKDTGEERTADKSANERRPNGVDRRNFVKSALLIGGATAVGSLSSIAGITTTVRADSTEPISAATRLNRQHTWDAYESTVASGNTAQPPNSLFLMLDYQGDGTPTPGHRRQVETALTEIERHFEWRSSGILFTMAYSAAYFDRFDESPPAGARPDDQQTVAKTIKSLTNLADTNDAITPDVYDAVLLLASENEANLLAVEAALWGDDNDLDISFDVTFEGVFEKPDAWPDRRVGFAGPEFQNREKEYEEQFLDDGQDIPDEAPLSMGRIAGFGESVPEEEIVTLKQDQRFPGSGIKEDAVPTDLSYVGVVGERDPGVFAQGTLKHISHLELDLDEWYSEDGEDGESGSAQRRHQMYSPYHTEAETNAEGGDKPGSGLVDDNADTPNEDGPDIGQYTVREYADRTPETAAGDETAETTEPTTGHSQKSARARYDIDNDGEAEQPVLRRDWDNIAPVGPDGADRAGYHFNVPMRFNESIYTLLDANYNVGFTSLDGDIDHSPVDTAPVKERNGIAPYMTATRRGNWLVPPITVRALPHPQAEEASISVKKRNKRYVVDVSDVSRSGGVIDDDTVRFGTIRTVNRARGAEPMRVSRRGNTTTFEFPASEINLSEGDQAKLFGKKEGTRKPIVGTATL